MELKYEIAEVVDEYGLKLGVDWIRCNLCGFEWYRYKTARGLLYSMSYYRKKFKPLLKDRRESLVCPKCKKVLLGVSWFSGKCPVCGKMVRVGDNSVYTNGKMYHWDCYKRAKL
jgi:predicted RNA-binding Zn-ribbon protein involved in translation (DUF1610 family)